MKSRKFVLGASLLAVAAATALSVSSAASAADPQAPAAEVGASLSAPVKAKLLGGAKLLRSTNFAAASGMKAPAGGAVKTVLKTNRPIPGKGTSGGPAAQAPSPNIAIKYPLVPSMKIVGKPSSVMAMQGLSSYDQEVAFGGYDLTPPDPEIAAGAGQIVQVVNNLIGIYDQGGHAITAPVSMENFFGDDVSFLSDPKAYWDPETKHWFVTELMVDFNEGQYSGVYIAVSQTSNAAGGWWIYWLDQADPFPNEGNNCFFDSGFACLPDQPLLGADKWTLQISTNQFDLLGFGFNGAQMFYIDKTALVTGALFPNVVGEDYNADFPTPPPFTGCGFPFPTWYSVQPAESPNGNYDLHWNGTSYALSALDFCNQNDNRISLWVTVNTRSVSSVAPNIGILQATVVNTAMPYGMPPDATQANGNIPLGNYWYDAYTSSNITANDDRMNEVEFNNKSGMLMGGLNTGAIINGQGCNGCEFRVAVAWFALKLRWSGSTLFYTKSGGYIASRHSDVLFPASTSVNSGNGVWAYSVTGDDMYPSAGASSFTQTAKPSTIVITNPGAGPSDTWFGYASGAERWGDYSGAVTDGNKVFMTSEYIANNCSLGTWLDDYTCGGTRGFWTNWSTSIAGTTLR